MSVTRTMMAMHSEVTVTSRSSVKRRFSEYGTYFARQWVKNEDYYRMHYATPDDYRRDTVRQCWPFVGDHCKRYLREAFDAELANH